MNQEQRIEYFMSEIARLSNQVVDLQDERDALAAQVEALRREIQSAADWFSAYWPELNKAQCDRIRQMDKIAKTTQQQHLAEIRAQAGREGFIAGYMLCNDGAPMLKHNCNCMADKYADSIRQGGAK